MYVCFDLMLQQKKKNDTSKRPHFSSWRDAFKMLITRLLCATSNANVPLYCREVELTLSFAYLMSVFLACTEEADRRQTPINNSNKRVK